MDQASLEDAILLALRRSPGSRSDELAEAVGLPRTNFGRQLKNGDSPTAPAGSDRRRWLEALTESGAGGQTIEMTRMERT